MGVELDVIKIDAVHWIPENVNYYPVIVHITDVTKGIDRKFYLGDLKDIQSGIIKLTSYEKELVFQALLNFYISSGDNIYLDFIDEAYKNGLSREHIKIRA